MKKCYIYIILSTILFSSMEIALKLIANEFNPIQITFLRFLIGGVILLPLSFKNLKERGISLDKGDLKFFASAGFICVVVSMILFQLAILYGKASIVAILFSCNPIFVIPFAYFILSEKINKVTVITLTMSIIGVICILNPLKMTSVGSGIIFAILAAAAFALYGVIGKTKCEVYGGVVSSCFCFIMGSAELLALILISKISFVAGELQKLGLGKFADIPVFKGITVGTIPSLIYVGIFVTGLGYTFYFLAMEESSAATASLVFYIKPALAPVLALIILKEAISLNTVVGILFIIAGSCVTFASGFIKNNSTESFDDEEAEVEADA